MKAYIFPGQGAQFEGMGKDLYESSALAKSMFEQADKLLGFPISEVMFEGTDEDLKQTKVTQPAVFLHSIIKAKMEGENFKPAAVAGHSLGEFSALVAAGAMDFDDGLKLVHQRAQAMQKACELEEGTMAAVIGLEDDTVEKICAGIRDTVVPANYNCPGQLVISGTVTGVKAAVEKCKEAGARRAILLSVGGAFHSPLMQPAQDELKQALQRTDFLKPNFPVYQNVNAAPETNPNNIRKNLIDQLTAPVRWTQTMLNMLSDGINSFTEVGGTGKVLRGFVMRVNRKIPTETL